MDWCMKLKPKIFMKILAKIKKFLILVFIKLSQGIIIIQKIVSGNMKDKTACVAIKLLVGLKS